jgi:hypothetical protein
MSTEIVVALVAAAAVGLQVLGTYLIRRTEANDQRTNLDRDIAIVQRLHSDSEEAKRLNQHISRRIDQIVSREERRAQSAPRLLFSTVFMSLLLAVYGLSYLRPEQERLDLRSLLDATYWTLWLLIALFVIRMVFDILRFIFQVLRTGWQLVDVSVRLIVAKLKSAKLAREKEGLWKELEDLIAKDVETQRLVDERKDHIISNFGQETWDQIVADRERFKRQVEELMQQREEDQAAKKARKR